MTDTKAITDKSFEGRDFWCLETSQNEKLQERVCFEKSDDIERGKGWLSVLVGDRLQTGPFDEVWSSHRRTIENAVKRFGLDVDRLLGPNSKEKSDLWLLDHLENHCFSAIEGSNNIFCFPTFQLRIDLGQLTLKDFLNLAILPGFGFEDPFEGARKQILCSIHSYRNEMDVKDVQKIYPFVERALRDPSPEIRGAAIYALVTLDPERAWERLTTQGLKDSKEEARAEAYRSLGKYSEQHSEKYAVPAYRLALTGTEDPNPSVQAAALESLGKLGHLVDADEAFNKIEKGIVAEDQEVQRGALLGLKDLKYNNREPILRLLSQVPGKGMLSGIGNIVEVAWSIYKGVATKDDYLSLLKNPDCLFLRSAQFGDTSYYNEFIYKLLERDILPEALEYLVRLWKDTSENSSHITLHTQLLRLGRENVQYRNRILAILKGDPSYQNWCRNFDVFCPAEKAPEEPPNPKTEEGCQCQIGEAVNPPTWIEGLSTFFRRR